MKKQNNSNYDDTLSQLDVLNELLYSAYKDLENLYGNDKYKEWSKLFDERHKLSLVNDSIRKNLIDVKIKKGEWDSETSEHMYNLVFYQAYNQAKKNKDIPEIFEAYLGDLNPDIKECIINQFRIDELNDKAGPYETFIDDTFKKANEYHAIIDYLNAKRKALIFNIPFEKLKINQQNETIEKMLKSYSKINSDIRKLTSRLEEYEMLMKSKGSGLKAYNFTRQPIRSGISDATGNEVTAKERMDEALRKLITLYETDIEKKIKLKENVDSMLNRLKREEQEVIRLEYFEAHDWNKKTGIPQIMKYSYPHCHRFKVAAFSKMRKMIENDKNLVVY